MILPGNKAAPLYLGDNDCRAAILERRESIRNHRDERGDDRCFLDDYLLWKWLSDSPPEPVAPISIEWGMEQCALFYNHRRAETADPLPKEAILDPRHWDDDLEGMASDQLHDELLRVQEGLRAHRDITLRPRTIADDRALYALLPEKVPADFRLPPEEEFLGEARAPQAGCPAFWRSHGGCSAKCHDLHRWGPCR